MNYAVLNYHMTTLKNDTLSFTFPETDEKLRQLIEQHVSLTLPAIVQTHRTRALKALHSSLRFREATPEERRNAEAQIVGATPERIAAALRRKSMSILHRGGCASMAALEIEFQRTLRIPDDGKTYPLPAGFGRFPLRHVDDYKDRVPASLMERGGVVMPMYQSEALWINFSSDYPFAVKVAAGKIKSHETVVIFNTGGALKYLDLLR